MCCCTRAGIDDNDNTASNAVFWMKRFPRHSRSHRFCLLLSGTPWLANARPLGLKRRFVIGRGPLTRRDLFSCDCQDWQRAGCYVQVKGAGDTQQKTFTLAESEAWDGNGPSAVAPSVQQQHAGELFQSANWTRNTFGVLGESAAVSTIARLLGKKKQQLGRTAACFQASHQQRMKAFKRGERRVSLFHRCFAAISHKVSRRPLKLLLLPGMRAFCRQQMQRVFGLNFGGTASQLVISGGRHGVHLAERHAGGCASLSASFVRPRWLISPRAPLFALLPFNISHQPRL